MLYYSTGGKKILNHDVAQTIEDLILHARSLICDGFVGDWSKLEMLLSGYAENTPAPQQALMRQIGIDNASKLAVLILKTENALIDFLEGNAETETLDNSTSSHSENDAKVPDKKSDRDLQHECSVIARLCWDKRIGIKHLAVHLKLSEIEVKKLRGSEMYTDAVETLIFATRTVPEIVRWIEKYPKKTMPSRFSKRMGIAEEDVVNLIERVLSRCETEMNK